MPYPLIPITCPNCGSQNIERIKSAIKALRESFLDKADDRRTYELNVLLQVLEVVVESQFSTRFDEEIAFAKEAFSDALDFVSVDRGAISLWLCVGRQARTTGGTLAIAGALVHCLVSLCLCQLV